METESSLRERLIDVGVDLVITEGSASLGLREIARRAGVSHGAPRRYFPTHHALLSAIARRGFADLGARFEAAISDTASSRAQLEALARAYVAYALDRRGMFELMFRHDLLDSEKHPSDRPRLRESTLPLFELIVGLVARCRTEKGATHRPGTKAGAEPTPAVVGRRALVEPSWHRPVVGLGQPATRPRCTAIRRRTMSAPRSTSSSRRPSTPTSARWTA